ncbi:MAG: cell division protein FtsQ [Flavobacteriaceae bacterium]|nr:cell division protein FtsQ [Candidatus Onthonaster equi]
MKRKEIILMILGFIVLAFLVSFSIIQNATRPVKEVDVKFHASNSNYFLNDSIIKEIASKEDKDIMSLTLNELDIKKIEDKVAKSPYVDSVQVSKDVKGIIHFDIKTSIPIVRVNTPKGEFYLSEKGYKMPLSKLNAALVLLVSGDVQENEYEDLSKFVQTLQNDELFKNHIIGIEKIGKRSYNLIVNRGNFYIEFGTLNNFEKKLHNLKLFYDQYINFVGTDQYEKLSLKFVNQVVATKRTIHDE